MRHRRVHRAVRPARPGATTIIPGFQHLEVGQLVARINAWYDWQHPLAGLSAALLMEFGDFAMVRGEGL
jgi:hypothetical protein